MSDLAERIVRRHLDEDRDAESDHTPWTEDEIDRVVMLTDGMLVTKPQKILRRIARGQQSQTDLRGNPSPSVHLLYGDGGIISSQAVIRLLDDRCGFLAKLRFRPSLTGLPNTVAWEAVNGRAEAVSGKLIIHAGIRGNTEVVSWAEVVVDE